MKRGYTDMKASHFRRDAVITTKTYAATKKGLRQLAKRDGRTLSSFLHFLLERTIAANGESSEQANG